jgi:hypothetical protein
MSLLNYCQRSLFCSWTCLHYRGLCCPWRCLHHKGSSCIWTCLHYSTGPVLLLDVSAPQGPELHLDLSTLQRHVLLLHHRAWATSLRVNTTWDLCCTWTYLKHTGRSCTWTCLHYHLDLVGQQEPMLLLDVQYLHYRGVSLTWTYFDYTGPIVHHNGADMREPQRSIGPVGRDTLFRDRAFPWGITQEA